MLHRLEEARGINCYFTRSFDEPSVECAYQLIRDFEAIQENPNTTPIAKFDAVTDAIWVQVKYLQEVLIARSLLRKHSVICPVDTEKFDLV